MNFSDIPVPTALPAHVEQLLGNLVDSAKRNFGEDLVSILLFGSGAEGRLRVTSDLNLVFVLRRFDKKQVDGFREQLRVAYVAQRASAMFVLESELESAAEAFAVKFDDIARRHRVLYGDNPISKLAPSRQARIRRLEQILMNLTLRLRERYAATSLHEESLPGVIADAAGPMRSAAATLLDLEGAAVTNAREALEQVAATVEGSASALEIIKQARREGQVAIGCAAPALFSLMALADAMRARVARLAEALPQATT